MSRLTSEIIVEDHTDEFARQMYTAIHRALDQAADIGVEIAHATPTEYRIQQILHAVVRSGVERTTKGQGVWLIAPDWRSLFFERGTYRRHRGKLNSKTVARRATPSGQARVANWNGNRGVKAQFFLRNATRGAHKALLDFMERECRKIR